MKLRKYYYSVIALLTAILFVWSAGCTRDFNELELAKYPDIPEVFIDEFSQGLNYAAFGGSKVTAFDVDNDVVYAGSASMKIEVPDAGDPEGAYAGGVYYTSMGRDLSGYDALTFWAKASKSATLDIIGLGNDLDELKYLASLKDVKINTNWKKYIIPLPDASKLTREKGMFYYSEGPEDGSGYTFWIDEVKFEKLGTIAHRQPLIQNGNDEVQSTVNGMNIPVTGLSVSFNLPTGIDQTVIAAPAYFSFASSNTNVATVNEAGMVNVLSEGNSVITAKLGGEDAEGSLTVQSLGEFTHAPDPTAEQADVISIFSDAYTNVPVDFYNGYWEPYQTTISADFTVDDDDVLFYTNFNFVGIQFTSPTIDASDMTHLHMDIWIPNAVDPADKLAVKLVDMGANGILDETDPTLLYDITGPLASQSWISVDIPISGLASKSKLAQIILERFGSTLSGFYLDNVYLYGNGGGTVTQPTEAAPVPPVREAVDVISIYGDAYTNLEGTDYPDWGQSTVVSDLLVEGNSTLKFAGLNYQGIQLAASQDVSAMEFLHIDYWSVNSTALNAFIISTGPVEKDYALTVPTTGWSSVDIPLSSFSPVNLEDIIQLKFDGNGDIYLDNIYFYKSGGAAGSEPAVAAPTPPVREAVDVLSLFSNAYTNETVDTWSAEWDDSDVADFQIGSDDIKKYTFTNFAGIDFSNNKLDASGMTHFHMDIWTPDDVVSKSLTIKNVDFGGGSSEATSHILTVVHTPVGDVPALQTGSWVSIDVPITAFTGDKTRSDLAQMVLSCNLSTLFVDNIYFYNSGGGAASEPAEAAATPTRDPDNVISIYSDAYTDISGVNLNPGWGQATIVTEELIAGNNTLLYTGLNYQGIDFDSNHQNVSAMEYLHLDFWSANSTALNVYLISPGNEKPYALTVPTNGNWTSIDIPLSEFSSVVDLTDLFQFKFDGNGDIYLDNIYFFTSGGVPATEPTTPAPTPSRDAADVISLFSDAYTDVTVNSWLTGWSSAMLEDVLVAGNAAKKYSALSVAGIETNPNTIDATGMTHFHMDVWSADITTFSIKLVDFGADGAYGGGDDVEHQIDFASPVQRQWVTYDIPLSDFTNLVTTGHMAQYILVGQPAGATTIWADNIYFYNEGGSGGETGPATAAPTPTVDPANVVSIYSDAYTDIAFNNFDAGWCGGSAVTEITIGGNNTLKKNAGIECHGIDFSSNKQDLSSYTHIHFDFYTDDTDLTGDVFNVKLVDFGGGESEVSALEVNINTGTTPGIVAGTWVSVDIDITALGGVVTNNLTRSDVAQIGITTANLTNVWYDNIYLYK